VVRIAVLGTLAVDRVVRLDAPLRVGAHQQGVALEDRCGGGGANAAVALARAGPPNPRVEGRDLEQLSEAELARFRASRLAIVFQQFHLMSGLTAVENVGLPLELQGVRDAGPRALAALEQVGLGARADHLPARLSGGECQRVAIARALVVEPALLLADEPSGSLDARTGAAVEELLFEGVERRSTTSILVTHSERLAARCAFEYQLSGGRLDRRR